MTPVYLHPIRPKVADENILLGLVPTGDAAEWFDHCASFLKPAIERMGGRMEPEHFRERIADGRMQLAVIWHAEKENGSLSPRGVLGALVTAFSTYPGGRALELCLLGGTQAHRWVDRVLEVERWAKAEEGCRWVELSGRFGWERVLRGLGYRLAAIQLVKDLDHG